MQKNKDERHSTRIKVRQILISIEKKRSFEHEGAISPTYNRAEQRRTINTSTNIREQAKHTGAVTRCVLLQHVPQQLIERSALRTTLHISPFFPHLVRLQTTPSRSSGRLRSFEGSTRPYPRYMSDILASRNGLAPPPPPPPCHLLHFSTLLVSSGVGRRHTRLGSQVPSSVGIRFHNLPHWLADIRVPLRPPKRDPHILPNISSLHPSDSS